MSTEVFAQKKLCQKYLTKFLGNVFIVCYTNTVSAAS